MNLRHIALIAMTAVFGLNGQEEAILENQEADILASETVIDNDEIARSDSCRREQCRPSRCPEKQAPCKTQCTKQEKCKKQRKGAAKRVVEGD